MLYTYNGIRFSLKKEGYPVTCYNMGEPWGHHAKGNMSVTKDKHYIIPLIRNMKNKQIHRIRKQISGFSGAESGSSYENVLKLDCGTAVQLCKLTKNYWIVHLQWWILGHVNYLNKVEKTKQNKILLQSK